MLIYSLAKSHRLDYVAGLIGRELFDAPVKVTTDPDEFTGFSGPKWQYGGVRLPAAPFYIPAVSLLFETGLRPQSPQVFIIGTLPMFFGGEGDLPFDLPAAVFFLLSRYEEWLPHEPDQFGRFAPASSVAFKNRFLQRPLIDEWFAFFRKSLQRVFPGLSLRRRSFRFFPTYDIDMAWSYTGKGPFRNTGGFIRDLLTFDFASARERRAVLTGKSPDPFDAFGWLDELHGRHNLRPAYFFLLADEPGRLDKNISPHNPAMRQLVAHHSARYDTGIHPSWQSGDKEELLESEINALSVISGKAVTQSRQHYLRFSMPVNFRRLIKAGIRHDFSMGYGEVNGFRASFTGDFNWYDLEKEEETGLLLTPFCFMDAAAFYGEGIDAESALRELRSLAEQVVRVNGRITTLWHNHFLGSSPEFRGWKTVYETFVREIAGHEGAGAGG